MTGARGQVGRELVRTLQEKGYKVLALARPDYDICRPADLQRLTAWRPDIVVNAAAWTDVDACASDPDRAMRINGAAAGGVAAAAAAADALVVQISTNEVFDGTLHRPYREEDEPNPINPYAASKLAGEAAVAGANERHLIVRTAWVFSATRGFPSKILAAAERARRIGEPVRVVRDEFGNPTPAAWLASAMVQLIELQHGSDTRTWHLAGTPTTSRLEWARQVLGDAAVVEGIPSQAFARVSRVPPRAVLDCSLAAAHGIALADWRNEGLPSG